jgi:hypothetical protein
MSGKWARFYLYLVMMVASPAILAGTAHQLLNLRDDIMAVFGIVCLVMIPPVTFILFIKVIKSFKELAAPAPTPEIEE